MKQYKYQDTTFVYQEYFLQKTNTKKGKNCHEILIYI